MDALTLTNLRKSYKGGVTALQGVSLRISEGDFFGLLGPNGAGKSTLIGIVASLVNKTSGQVSVYGFDLDHQINDVKKSLGLVPQEFNFNVFEKVFDILMQQAGYYGIDPHLARQRTEKYLKKLELWDKRHEPARNLSGGMKRRLMIARAMVHEPRLLILDEPTAGVDVEVRHAIWNFLREINQNGTTIILTSHYLEEVEELCKNIAIINNGKILANTSLKRLLNCLSMHTFILELSKPLSQLPTAENLAFKQIDATTLEVSVAKDLSLDTVFGRLSDLSLQVSNIRSKTNRLETLFLAIVNNKLTNSLLLEENTDAM